MKVYTLHHTDMFGGDYITCFDSMDAVIKRLEIHAMCGIDDDDKYIIEVHDVTTLDQQTERTNNVRNNINKSKESN